MKIGNNIIKLWTFACDVWWMNVDVMSWKLLTEYKIIFINNEKRTFSQSWSAYHWWYVKCFWNC
jgi:hypothetical protein